MGEEVNRQQDDAVREEEESRLSPGTRMILRALMLPVMGLLAAGVLVLVGISLVFAALVLIGALVAGAVSVPLSALAGRRRISRTRYAGGEVLDAQATVREKDASEGDEGTNDLHEG